MIGVGRQKSMNVVSDDTSSEASVEIDIADQYDSDDGELETWTEWIQRATRIAEAQLEGAGIEDWLTLQRRRLYRWAGHAARRTDGRWSHRVLDWVPSLGGRSVGRPSRRWSDDINDFFVKETGLKKGEWMSLAQCRDTWRSFEDDFCKTRR